MAPLPGLWQGKERVSPTSREQVLRAAEELGYVHNAAAALLASKRGRSGGRLRVGHIDHTNNPPELFISSIQKLGLEGGWEDGRDYDHPRQFLRVLHARGVDGLFLNFNHSPWTEAQWREANWSGFSVIKNGRGFPKLPFHLVRHDAYDYMRTVLMKVRKAGHNKIAVILHPSESVEDDEARCGAVLVADQQLRAEGGWAKSRNWGNSEAIGDDPETLKWLEQINPDATVSFLWVSWYPLRRAGWRFPEDAGFASLLRHRQMPPGVQNVSGCLIGNAHRFDRAVEQLTVMIGNGERGEAQVPMEYVIEPKWVSGETLGVPG